MKRIKNENEEKVKILNSPIFFLYVKEREFVLENASRKKSLNRLNEPLYKKIVIL
jgi:hypothetical protein